MSRNREEGLSIGQEHELIEKLKSAGISAKEVQAIVASPDNTLAKKLVEVANEFAQDKRAGYERLFEGQLATLYKYGYPTSIIALLEAQEERVIETALELNGKVSEWEHPFLPVVPRECRSAFDLFYGLDITPRIDMTKVEYFEEVPKLPYYVFNVRYEATDKRMSPEDWRLSLKTEEYPERYGMTDAELAALLRHCYQGEEKKKLVAVNTNYFIDGKRNENQYVVGTALNYGKTKTGTVEIGGNSWSYSWPDGHVNSCAPSVIKRLEPELTKRQIENCLAKGK